MSISAIVLTHNSEDLIDDCLKSLSRVREVIVVDDSSSDETKNKVGKYRNTKFIAGKHGFSENRNIGAKEAKGDWLLYVDDDERVTPKLQVEAENVEDTHSAYAIPRRNYILGKEFKHSGQYPDYVKRLFKKKDLIRWVGELHEEPEFKGRLGYLKNALVHKKHDNLSDMVAKTNEWSEIEAKLMDDANHPKMNIIRFFSAMTREFLLRMVKQMAFLDGVEGVIYAIYQVFSKSISYAKLWEMQISEASTSSRKNESGNI